MLSVELASVRRFGLAKATGRQHGGMVSGTTAETYAQAVDANGVQCLDVDERGVGRAACPIL